MRNRADGFRYHFTQSVLVAWQGFNQLVFSGVFDRSEAQLGEEDASADPGHLLQVHGLANHLHLEPRWQGIIQDEI